MKRTLLYRVVPETGMVVFAPPERAVFVARILGAISSSATWDDFQKAMPRDEYARILWEGFDQSGEPRPRSSDAFSAESLPGWSEGDYPPWLQQEMDLLIPREVLEQFGTLKGPLLGRAAWQIPVENLEEICAALTSMGWELEPAQELPFL